MSHTHVCPMRIWHFCYIPSVPYIAPFRIGNVRRTVYIYAIWSSSVTLQATVIQRVASTWIYTLRSAHPKTYNPIPITIATVWLGADSNCCIQSFSKASLTSHRHQHIGGYLGFKIDFYTQLFILSFNTHPSQKCCLPSELGFWAVPT